MKQAISRANVPIGSGVPRLPDDVETARFEIRVDAKRQGRFEDVRDAVASAHISKRDHPLSRVSVADLTTGQIIIEVER